MIAFSIPFLHALISPFRTRARLEAEIALLRHQLNVLRRRVPSEPRLTVADRLLFVWLYRLFPSALSAVTIVQPDAVVRWHRTGFRLYWRWKSRSRADNSKAKIIWPRSCTARLARRIEPISLSAYPFCHGDRAAIGWSRMPIAARRLVTA